MIDLVDAETLFFLGHPGFSPVCGRCKSFLKNNLEFRHPWVIQNISRTTSYLKLTIGYNSHCLNNDTALACF
jgi:hypothetical protein